MARVHKKNDEDLMRTIITVPTVGKGDMVSHSKNI